MPREATPNELSAAFQARERCEKEQSPDKFMQFYAEALGDDDPDEMTITFEGGRPGEARALVDKINSVLLHHSTAMARRFRLGARIISRDAADLASPGAAPFGRPLGRYDQRDADAAARARDRCQKEGAHDRESFKRYYRAELEGAA